jgi:hypothetical protein
MRRVAIGLLAAGLAFGNANIANAIFITDDSADGPVDLDIQSVLLSTQDGALRATVFFDTGPRLPGDAVAVYVDSDNNAQTGETEGDGSDWRFGYQLSRYSGNEIASVAPWIGGETGYAFGAALPSGADIFAAGGLVSFSVPLSVLGLTPDATIRVSITSSTTLGPRDYLPDDNLRRFAYHIGRDAIVADLADADCARVDRGLKTRASQIRSARRAVLRARTPVARRKAQVRVRTLTRTQVSARAKHGVVCFAVTE